MLEIKDLSVSTGKKKILKNINLKAEYGDVVALEGKNGSGKSTLLSTIMGDFKYSIDSGSITFDDKEINNLEVKERSDMGIFLAHQHPIFIEGLSMLTYLKHIYESKIGKNIPVFKFRKILLELCKQIDYPEKLLERDFNFNFSGGEKKKTEFLQLMLLQPKLILLDEIDSGVDRETVKTIFSHLSEYTKKNKCILILVSHYDHAYEFFGNVKKYKMQEGELGLF